MRVEYALTMLALAFGARRSVSQDTLDLARATRYTGNVCARGTLSL